MDFLYGVITAIVLVLIMVGGGWLYHILIDWAFGEYR